MGMPQIPEGTHRPDNDEVVIDLFESIALQEMAIAHILNAEGEKLQLILQKYKNEEISFCDLESMSKLINTTITDLIMKEWLLISKFNSVASFSNYTPCHKPCKCSCKDGCKEHCRKEVGMIEYKITNPCDK